MSVTSSLQALRTAYRCKGEGGQKLTFFQSDRKKGGESGETGVGGDDDFFWPEHRFRRFQRLFRGRFGKMAAAFLSPVFKNPRRKLR